MSAGKNTKHTPGPWVVEYGEGLAVRDAATDSRLCTLSWLKGRHGLAGRLSDAEVAANALVFAAAPELLEALEAAHKRLRNGTEVDQAFAAEFIAPALTKAGV